MLPSSGCSSSVFSYSALFLWYKLCCVGARLIFSPQSLVEESAQRRIDSNSSDWPDRCRCPILVSTFVSFLYSRAEFEPPNEIEAPAAEKEKTKGKRKKEFFGRPVTINSLAATP
jgi:hypothetical protein